MFPVYLVIGLINIFAKTENYDIKSNNPEMDIRVRRDVSEHSILLDHLYKSQGDDLIRNKRQFYFFSPKKTNKPVTSTPKYITQSHPRYRNNNGKLDYNFATQNNGMLKHNQRFTSKNVTAKNYNNNWNVSNTLRYNNNANNVTYSRNNVTGFHEYRPNITVNNFNNSYNGFPGNRPYPYVNTLMPKFNISGYQKNNQSGYNGQAISYYDPNTQQIYNYQDPTMSNFSGYFQHNYTKYYNGTIKPHAPGYLPIPVFKPGNTTTYWYNKFNNTMVPFPAGYAPITPGYGPTTPGSVATTPVFDVTTRRRRRRRKNGTLTTTTEISIAAACVIGCSSTCPDKYHFIGGICVPDVPSDDDYEYY